jgi:FMN phosphatase YigB (HAD superfamily)
VTLYCDTKRHLICVPYSVENLHQMAAQLGIKRCWFHAGDKPHYDIPKKRIQEITARCVVVDSKKLLQLMR